MSAGNNGRVRRVTWITDELFVLSLVASAPLFIQFEIQSSGVGSAREVRCPTTSLVGDGTFAKNAFFGDGRTAKNKFFERGVESIRKKKEE